MEELNFYVKKLQDLEYRGDWKEHYKNSFEKIRDFIDQSGFARRGFYLKELDRFNGRIMDMPYISGNEDKLHFRKIQKNIIDLLYQVMTENKKIFLVNGSNTLMADKVSSFLGRLRLDFDLMDEEEATPDIKKFTKKAKNCDYAVVLFSANEKVDNENQNTKWRVSQNVLLELGYFLSQVGKKNIVIFSDPAKELETPYNLEGLSCHPFTPKGGWKVTLVTELRKAGIYVNEELVNKVMDA